MRFHRLPLSVALLGCLIGLTCAIAWAEKTPIPGDDALAKSKTLLREVFGTELAKAKTNAERLAIAEEMIKQAGTTRDDLPGQFALLSVGRDIAAQAGGIEVALQAIDQLEAIFEIKGIEMRRDLLVAAGKTIKGPKELGELAAKTADAAEQAAAVDRYDVAKELSDLASSLARRTANAQLIKDLTARGSEMQSRVKEGHLYQTAVATLGTKPDDPEANLTVGKFHFFQKADFAAGMPYLAKGSDPVLRAAAVFELSNPTGAAELTRLGDVWLEQAEKEKDSQRKARLRQRARHWYETALPGLTGLVKTKVEHRLEDLAKSEEAPPAAGPARPVPGGKKQLSAKGKFHVSGDDTFDLAINGKSILTGSQKAESIEAEVRVGDILSVHVANKSYEHGLVLIFLSEDKHQVFFTTASTWRAYVPADPLNWQVVKPSPQDLPAKDAHRNYTKVSDEAAAGYGADSIWGYDPQSSFLYHVVSEADLEILGDPPVKGSKKGVAVTGKLSASGDDMFDLTINGKPIYSGRAQAEAQATVELRPGDTIAVRAVNSQYETGFACAFVSADGAISFFSNASTWVAYQPSDPLRWWRLRGNEAKAPVRPGSSRGIVLAPNLLSRAVNIWWSDQKSSGYLLHVVTEQDLKKAGK